MVVRNEIEGFATILESHRRLHRTEEISDVKFSARLKASKDSHDAEHGFPVRNRSSGYASDNAGPACSIKFLKTRR